jgi:hypothetical protein
MPKHHLLRKIENTRLVPALCIVVIVAAIGTHLLLGSHAASPYVSSTAAAGALDSGAAKQSCSGASDGTCVTFGSSTGSSPYYSGKLLGLNSNFDDLSEVGDSNAYQELHVNSIRGDIELSGSTFEAPTYTGTGTATQLTSLWLDTLTTQHIVPEPLLNQYVEMSDINDTNFVNATVAWCHSYCAGGSFYKNNTSADETYAPQTLEILNEPYGNWWGYSVTPADVAAYATLLKDIRAGLNTAGLQNIDILAAANDNSVGTENWNTDLVNNGGFAAVQGVTEHPYGPVDTSCTPSTSTTDCTVTSGDTDGTNTNGWGLTYYIHQFLTSNGLSAQANNVYDTEVGYCNETTTDSCSGGSFTETQKDQNITAIISALHTEPWLKAIEYFDLIPYQDSGIYNTYGLYSPYPVLAKTPAWTTYQTAAEANGL